MHKSILQASTKGLFSSVHGNIGNVRRRGPTMSSTVSGQPTIVQNNAKPSEHDLLLRVARGEKGERTPVWLMRQAGRYMKAFKEYSDKYPFRVRSETPDIAIELSLQPFRAFGTDGVIMFSDILTPLPSMGIEFDVVKGSGPVIFDPIRSAEQVSKLKKIDDPDKTTPFLRTILSSLRKVRRTVAPDSLRSALTAAASPAGDGGEDDAPRLRRLALHARRVRHRRQGQQELLPGR
jgi:uroporphyrinogen-III decarboxylase